MACSASLAATMLCFPHPLPLAPACATPPLPASIAAPVVDFIAELLGADAAVRRLVAHAEDAATRHGGQGAPTALAGLDACLLLAEGMGGVLESCYAERSAHDPPPEWLEGTAGAGGHGHLPASTWAAASVAVHCTALKFCNALSLAGQREPSCFLLWAPCAPPAGLLRLFALVPDPPAGWDRGAPAADAARAQLLTILHTDLLSSFAALGHLVMPLLLQASQARHQQARGVGVGTQLVLAVGQP